MRGVHNIIEPSGELPAHQNVMHRQQVEEYNQIASNRSQYGGLALPPLLRFCFLSFPYHADPSDLRQILRECSAYIQKVHFEFDGDTYPLEAFVGEDWDRSSYVRFKAASRGPGLHVVSTDILPVVVPGGTVAVTISYGWSGGLASRNTTDTFLLKRTEGVLRFKSVVEYARRASRG